LYIVGKKFGEIKRKRTMGRENGENGESEEA
jgi:hypothetical protein